MLRFVLLVLPALVLMTSCTRTRPMQVVMDIPPIVRAPDLLKQLDLNVPKDLARSALRDAAVAESGFDAAPAFLARTKTPDDAARAIDCLTAAVYYEARSESDEGERAVAQVVLNRVRDPAFPSSICGVVYQGSTRPTGCQFSFSCDGSMNHPIQPAAWARARAVATGALAGLVYAPVGSATFYHANYVSPWWASSMKQVASVGAHIFYRWRGAMENALAFRQSYSGSESLPARTNPILAASDDAGAVPSSAVNGGIQVVGSVTIHRSTPDEAVPTGPTPVTTAATDTGVAGIRIHRGGMAPALAQDVGKPRHITVPPASDPA